VRGLTAAHVRADRRRAVHLHELGCARDSTASCNALADALEAGAYIDKDMVRAAALRAKLCEQRVGDACWRLAHQVLNGDGVHLDEDRADRLLDQACEAGSAEGCAWGTNFRKRGRAQRAFDLYLAQCEAGDFDACMGAYRMTDERVIKTKVPPAAWAAVAATQQTACTAGSPDACANLSTLAYDGLGVPADAVAADGYANRACELGSGQACAFLANRLGNDPAVNEKLVALRVRACDLGDHYACWNPGPAVTADLARHRAVAIRACEVGVTVSCLWAMDMLDKGIGGPVDHARARQIQVDYCSQGDAYQCSLLSAEAVNRGDLVAQRDFQRRACRAEQRSGGCTTYASLLRTACDAHDAASCQELDRFLASLPPPRRDLAVVECCHDQRPIPASPGGQLAGFFGALARKDVDAARAFIHPRRGMKLRTWWEAKRDSGERTIRVRPASLRLAVFEDVPVYPDALDCPDDFDNNTATCTSSAAGLPRTYQLLRDRGRIYVIAIDARLY
jgi:TPR repeat protein